MAYAPHVYAAWGGELLNGDIWGNGIRLMTATGQLPEADVEDYLAAMAPGLSDWFAAAQSHHAPSASLTFLKLNNIGADGKYPPGAPTHRHDYNPAVNGGGSGAGPAIVSTCISFKTAKARGTGANGRVYPPNFGGTASATGKVTQAVIDDLVAAGGALLDAVSLYANPGAVGRLIPVIASRKDASLTRITTVRVGDEFDVQRRRKNAVPEIYSSTAWAHQPS